MKQKKTLLITLLAITAGAGVVYAYRLARTSSEPPIRAVTQRIQDINSPDTTEPELQTNEFLVSEPASYKNLSVFLIYSKEEIEGDRYLTLEDALSTKMVYLKETEDVNMLQISNKSDKYVYINSGDIVRGGKQDRTIQYDVILPPHSKNINLASFCVESGRWESRGNEASGHFSSSKNSLASKDLKVAAKMKKDQSEVWAKVETYQSKANGNLSYTYDIADANVQSEVSQSSLELTLENDDIKKLSKDFRKELNKQFGSMKNAVGIAVYINGKPASIDIYNNKTLFADLFEKLINAAIAEAISEKAEKNYKDAESRNVAFLITKESRLLNTEFVNRATLFRTYKLEDKMMLFTCIDRNADTWLHKNWLEAGQHTY